MAVLHDEKFNGMTLGLDPSPDWTTRTQDGTPPNFPVVQNAQLDGTQKLRNQLGSWNWQRFDGIGNIGDTIAQVRCGINGALGDIRVAVRNTFFRGVASNFPGDGYMFTLDSANNIVISRLDDPLMVTLATTSFPVGSSKSDFILRGEVEGSALRLYIDGNLELSTTDATYTSGKVTVGGFNPAGGFALDDLLISNFIPDVTTGKSQIGVGINVGL